VRSHGDGAPGRKGKKRKRGKQIARRPRRHDVGRYMISGGEEGGRVGEGERGSARFIRLTSAGCSPCKKRRKKREGEREGRRFQLSSFYPFRKGAKEKRGGGSAPPGTISKILYSKEKKKKKEKRGGAGGAPRRLTPALAYFPPGEKKKRRKRGEGRREDPADILHHFGEQA